MKRIMIAVVAFIIVLAIGVIGTAFFDITCNEMTSAIERSVSLCRSKDYNAAANTVDSAKRFWEDRRRLLTFYVNHSLLYEVDSRLTGLSSLAADESKEEFLYSAEQVLEAIRYLKSDK